MSINNQLTKLRSVKTSIKSAITAKGVTVGDDMSDYADAIGQLGTAVDKSIFLLEPFDASAITLQMKSGTTNVSVNDHIRIVDADNKAWTVSEWHTEAVENNFDKTLRSAPVAFRFMALGKTYDWFFANKYRAESNKTYYDVSGSVSQTNGGLRHSQYQHPLITGAYSHTDSNGTVATATVSGDNIILSTTNSPRTWTMKKDCGAYNGFQCKTDGVDYCDALLAQTEWFRHRAAIDSGLTTTEADGTAGTVTIVTSGGEMYFAVNGTTTDKLAKYNIHAIMNGDNPTSAIIDAIYAAQKAAGTNMNASCANGDAIPVVTEGSKGAEAYAYNGKWMIVTPVLTRCAATLTLDYNIPDAPCVAYVRNFLSTEVGRNNLCMPNEAECVMYQANRNTILNSIITYLNNSNGENWGVPATVDTDLWSFVRYGSDGAWCVSTICYVPYTGTCGRYVGAGVSAL